MCNNQSQDIVRYVAAYIKYQHSKADRHSSQIKLVTIVTGECPFKTIEIQFLGELPESRDFNTIQVVIDQFTEAQNYILGKRTCTAVDVANSNINNIW